MTAVTGPYELIYGFVHCVGRTYYHAGYADSQDEASRWVAQHTGDTRLKIGVPETDPARWCPVRHCHMKRQKPWFGYRLENGAAAIRRSSDREGTTLG